MLAPLLTCTMCLCASLQAQYAAGFIRLRRDGRNDGPQASHFKHNSMLALAALQTLFLAVVYHQRTNLYNCLYTTGLYSQTVHTSRRRHPTGGTSPRPHRGFYSVIVARSACYTKCALLSSAFSTKNSFKKKKNESRE